jgi:hypothetical protein
MKKIRKFQYLLALVTITIFSFGSASCGGDEEESGGSASINNQAGFGATASDYN